METTENDIVSTNTVNVDATELAQLIELNKEFREDLGVLVSVLHSITGLFSGKKSAISMVPTIMKLVNDPKQLEQFQHIVPIIDKYIPKTEENNAKG